MYFLKELTAKDDAKLMKSFEGDKDRTAHSSMFTYFTDVALVTTEKKGFMQLVNLKTGLFQTYLTHFDGGHIPRTGPLQFAALSPALYVAHRECHHVLYCLGTSNELLCGNFHTGQVAVVGEFSSRPSCVFADGEYAACGTSDGTIHLWRATTLLYDGYDLRYSPHPGDESIQKSFSFTAGGGHSNNASPHNLSGAEAVLKVNDSGSILWRRKAHRSAIKTIQIDRDFMIVACADFTVAVHSLHGSGEQLASFQYDSHLTIGVVPLGPTAHRLTTPHSNPSSMGIDFGVLNIIGEMRMYGAAASTSAFNNKRGSMTTDGVVGRVDHGSNPGSNWEVLGAPLQLVEIDTSSGDHHRFQQLTPTCVTTRNGFVLVGTTEGFVVVYSVGPPSAGYPISELCVLNISASTPQEDGRRVGGGSTDDPITNIEVLADDHLVVLTKTGSVWRWPMSEVMQQVVPEAVQTVEEDESYINSQHHAHQFEEEGDDHYAYGRGGGYDTPTGEEEEAPPVARSTVRAPTPKDNTNTNTTSNSSYPQHHSNNNMDTGMGSYYHDPSGHAHESMALGSHIRAPFDFEADENDHDDDGVEVVDMGAAESYDNTDYDDDGATDASVAVPSTLRGGAGKYAPSSVGVTFSESPSSIGRGGGQRRNSNRQQHHDDDGATSGTNLGSDVRAIHNALNNNEEGSGRGGSSGRSPRSRVMAAVADAAYDPQAYAAPSSHMQVAIPTVKGLKEGRRADPRKVAALVSQLKDHADNSSANQREGLFVPTSTVEEPDHNDDDGVGQVSPRDVDAYKIAHQLEVSAMRMRIAQQGPGARGGGGGYKRGDVYFADPELQSRIGDMSHTDSITGGGLLMMEGSDHQHAPSPTRTRSSSSSPHHRTIKSSAPSPPRNTNNAMVVGSSPIGGTATKDDDDGQAGSSMDSGMMGSQAGEADASPSRSNNNRVVAFSPHSTPQHHQTNNKNNTNNRSVSSPRGGGGGCGKVSSPPTAAAAPPVDDLVDATFLQYARKVDAEYEKKRSVPGPNIHAHLCDALLHPHLAPTHLGHVSALEDGSSPSSSPNTPNAPNAPPPTRIGALKKLSTFAPLSDVTGRINNSTNNTAKPAVGLTMSKTDSKVGMPATNQAVPPPQYVPDIVFFFEPEMRWSASATKGGITTTMAAPAPRLMGQTAFLTADESNTLFGKDPFDESALPGLELPLGTML